MITLVQFNSRNVVIHVWTSTSEIKEEIKNSMVVTDHQDGPEFMGKKFNKTTKRFSKVD